MEYYTALERIEFMILNEWITLKCIMPSEMHEAGFKIHVQYELIYMILWKRQSIQTNNDQWLP